MIYTIGHKANYLSAINMNGAITKTGRSADYQGGIVCLTIEDAQQAIREVGQPSYAVFGVEADWERDTVPSAIHRWHDLLVDSPIVVLSDYKIGDRVRHKLLQVGGGGMIRNQTNKAFIRAIRGDNHLLHFDSGGEIWCHSDDFELDTPRPNPAVDSHEIGV